MKGEDKCQWLAPQADDMHAVRILYGGIMSRHVNEDRKLDLMVFGATVALSLLEGCAPLPIDPCIIQYLIHGSDIHSLHAGFVGQWHSELVDAIRHWQDAGPNGDIRAVNNILMSYMNTNISL